MQVIATYISFNFMIQPQMYLNLKGGPCFT